MTDLERFLSNRNADADTWIDDEGLHVHDWETDRCLLFDANESERLYLHLYPCTQNVIRLRCLLSRNLNV